MGQLYTNMISISPNPPPPPMQQKSDVPHSFVQLMQEDGIKIKEVII